MTTTKICRYCGAPKGKRHILDEHYPCPGEDNGAVNYVELMGRFEACPHGNCLWCDKCNTDTYLIHSAIARVGGLKEALTYIHQLAGEYYVKNKDDQAQLLREVANRIQAMVTVAEGEEQEIRRQQNPELYDADLQK